MPKKHFDLMAELAADPPKRQRRYGIFSNPRASEWLDKFVTLRLSGAKVTNEYIAEKLTKGARLEGIIGPEEVITESNVRANMRERCRAVRG